MYQKILIATDGSELACKGVEQGLALAARLHAAVIALTVSEPIINVYDDGLGWSHAGAVSAEYQQAIAAGARKILDAVMDKAAQAGVAATPLHVVERFAAEAIIEAAQSHGCDLIVMASHGRRGLGRFLIGSQTNEVLTRSQVPVLVIR